MKILICEDEEIMLTALEFRLQRQGFEVVIAKDGQEALQLIEAGDADLVILDIMLPSLSGLQLIQHLREVRKSKLPVIIISALEHDDIVLEAFRLGASDFITKPFKPNELILRIKRIFQEMEMLN